MTNSKKKKSIKILKIILWFVIIITEIIILSKEKGITVLGIIVIALAMANLILDVKGYLRIKND